MKDEDTTSCEALQERLAALWPSALHFYPAGVNLIKQGFPVQFIYVLMRGVVKLSFVEESGREIIANLRPSVCIVGADAALLQVPSLVTATTVTGCRIRQIPIARIMTLLQNNASLSFYMSCSIARESLTQTGAVIDMTSGNARQRLLRLLSHFTLSSDDAPAAASAGTLLKKNEIAKLLAITPEHLSRLIRGLRRDGILDSHDRKIVLRRAVAAGCRGA